MAEENDECYCDFASRRLFGCNSREHDPLCQQFSDPTLSKIERLRSVLLNIQALAERGHPIDPAKLAQRCRRALEDC